MSSELEDSDFLRDELIRRMGRQADRRPDDRDLLSRLLRAYPAELGPRSLLIAVESGSPVVLAIEDALDEKHGATADELARHLEPHLPWPTMSLRTVARTVTERGAVIAAGDDGQTILKRAGRLINLSVRSRDVGLLAESLEAGRSAIELLGSANDNEANLLHVVTAVSNVLVTLIEMGDYAEAERVADDARTLLDSIPRNERTPEHDLHRARIVSSGALAEYHRGRTDRYVQDTRWAVDVFRRLVDDGDGDFRVELGRTLSNLALFLTHAGSPKDAYRTSAAAVRCAVEAVERNADRSMPELALALLGLASRSRAIGRRARAVAASSSALEIYRNLTSDDLLSHGRHLATCLLNHLVYLGEAGAEGDRVEMAREAVGILEAMHRERQNSVDDELAIAYSTYAGIVLAPGNTSTDEESEAALTALNNAVIVIQRCRSPGSRLRLAALLINLANASSVFGRVDEERLAKSHAAEVLNGSSAEELASIPGLADIIRSRF